MILYKYVPFLSGMKILESSSIGFARPKDFNDPFEMSAFQYEDNNEKWEAYVTFAAVRNRCNSSFGVLSLTRQPLNGLMWSHYADSHRGMVIGFDIEACGFNDIETNVIPANYEEIIYTRTKPQITFPMPSSEELMEIGNDVSKFSDRNYSFFKAADPGERGEGPRPSLWYGPSSHSAPRGGPRRPRSRRLS